ncbi:MAG: hypothetical protein QGG58_00650 [Chloroflexota bacterium]|nr:hypothetical protein [Chloroflexota bacterium]
MRAALLPATRPGLVGGGAALAIVVLGMVTALNERELAGLPVGNLLVGLIVLAVGYRAARDAVGAGSRLVAGLVAGLTAGAFLALFMLFTRVPGVSEKLVQTEPEDTDAILFGMGAGGAALLAVFGAGLGVLGGVLASLPALPTGWLRAVAGSGRLRLILVALLSLLIVGLALAFLFGLVVAVVGVIVLAGLELALLGGALASLPPLPARLRQVLPKSGAGRRRLDPVALLTLLIMAVVLIVVPMAFGQYFNHVSTTVGIFVLMGLGLNVVVGYAGLLDLGYVAFFAIGAYAMAILSSPEQGIEVNFWLALPIAMAVSGISGTLLGIPVLRMRGDYLAIVTLGFGEIIRIFSQNLTDLTGGPQGVRDIARPELAEQEFTTLLFANPQQFYFYLIATGVVLVAIISAHLLSSRIGRAWVAMREDEDVARAIGIRVVRYKLLAFTIGAVFAGLGGAIFASRQNSIFPNDFTLIVSINVLCLVIIGGMGSVRGVVVGSVALIALPEILRELAEFRLVTFGALLVFMMIVRPQGLLPAGRSLVSGPASLDIAAPPAEA